MIKIPKVLLRRESDLHKNWFGHVVILAGSGSMLGAAALCGLSAMRSGAGLVTIGIAKNLNLTLQNKISPVIMTLPLNENSNGEISIKAYRHIKTLYSRVQSFAIGPGLGQGVSISKLFLKIIQDCPVPLVIDADALNILAKNMKILRNVRGPRILTPHAGEMGRLTGLSRQDVENKRKSIAQAFARKYKCVLLLKGQRTLVASPSDKIYVNTTGNVGMATAGSGDVLTGMIAAFLAQGIAPFEAACIGAYLHGKAGDAAARVQGKVSMIATDLIERLPDVLSGARRRHA